MDEIKRHTDELPAGMKASNYVAHSFFFHQKIFTESLNKMAYMEKYFHSTLDYIFIDQIKLGGHRPTLGDDIMSPAPVDHHHHQHKSHRLHKCDGSYTRPERTYNNTPPKCFQPGLV
jgi:hypothetical protein